ncbi:hypothetical protein MMC22_009714 [Lobaria immixta]|nr:hypothetical protein [Lobaria immixta]
MALEGKLQIHESRQWKEKIHYRASSADYDDHLWEIRLVRLHPSDKDQPIQCDLVDNVVLENFKDECQAISYCVGEPDINTVVIVNGIPFNAFIGVMHTLRQVRRTYHSYLKDGIAAPLLWVDQICINHSDPIERSHQVVLMREVYHNAFQTLIWLDGDDSAGEELQLLAKVVDAYQHLFDPEAGQGSKVNRAVCANGCAQVSLEPAMSGRFSHESKGLKDLISSPWFTRCWILQEFFISWEQFQRGMTLYRDIHNALSSLNNDTHDIKIKDELLATLDRLDLSSVSRIFDLQHEWEGPEGFASGDMKVILDWTRGFKSSDPRDRAYALTEFADSGYGVVPDYSASMNIQSIFLETARKIIAFDRSLDLLTYVEAHSVMGAGMDA